MLDGMACLANYLLTLVFEAATQLDLLLIGKLNINNTAVRAMMVTSAAWFIEGRSRGVSLTCSRTAETVHP